MIVIAGTVSVAPESQQAARDAASRMQRETQAEPGCLAYHFSTDLESDTTFHLFEAWESESALAAHFTSDHMQRFRAELAELTVESRKIRRYDVTDVSEL